ncbi:Carbohydrate kinase FGGY N-terminal domain-containing protein [Caenorhabditis elegans]|uniref:Carbohydrate kinase FGGY N-terminal domain-containing protein n=1 Tax=Caenorhabditis elegans TaxID=6239 RepID=O45814_CAEEL|nr:Carbohydrate kinase FGGY N-terminal domain-containing protein [Caenorhabditis elegans]CAB05816.3 Carbohydrate kinase FGGY N-terminal domain-containing protein [Caenorhabditis elegans]
MTEQVHVGIDIGTTSAKICARNGENVILEFKKIYEGDNSDAAGLQNPKIIIQTVLDLLERTKSNLESRNLKISNIWTCGQMHGIVMWKQRQNEIDLETLTISPLYNWTYSSTELPAFLKTIPKWECGDLHPGFGLVTLAFLNYSNPEFLTNFIHCGTIMDLFISILTQNPDPLISHHNAHSWGYCTENATWQSEILDFLPKTLKLPDINSSSEVSGTWHGAKCHVASGDLQASVASLDYYENTAYVILGTSAQLCCLIQTSEKNATVIPATVVRLPFSTSKTLVAACAMNGGNALEATLKMNSPEVYSSNRLQELLNQLDKSAPAMPPNLRIDPIFIPERGSSKTFSISGTSDDPLQLLEATHQGIIRNLFELFPIPLLKSLKIRRVALVGSAQSPRFRRHLEEACGSNNFELLVSSSPISTPLGATKFF